MLESFLFIILIVFFIFIALVVIIIGLLIKNVKLTRIGLYSFFGFPILIVILYFFWYAFVVPIFNNSFQKEYSGTYKLENVKEEFKIYLNSDGTYYYDNIPNIDLPKKGTWKTGGIDGAFEFYNVKGNLVKHVGNGIYPDETKVITIGNQKFIKVD